MHYCCGCVHINKLEVHIITMYVAYNFHFTLGLNYKYIVYICRGVLLAWWWHVVLSYHSFHLCTHISAR